MGECSELGAGVGGGGIAPPPRQSVAHPAGYPWRVALLRCPLPFHRLMFVVVRHRSTVKRPALPRQDPRHVPSLRGSGQESRRRRAPSFPHRWRQAPWNVPHRQPIEARCGGPCDAPALRPTCDPAPRRFPPLALRACPSASPSRSHGEGGPCCNGPRKWPPNVARPPATAASPVGCPRP